MADERAFHKHQPERLLLLAARNDNVVSVQWRWRLLRTTSPGGSYVFSICEPENRVPCPDAEPRGDLFERMKEAGGFSVRADDLSAALEDLREDGSAAST